MQTKTISAYAVRAGMHVFLAGSVYAVESNLFDRHGKALYEPLNILVCNSTLAEHVVGQGEHFGLLPTQLVTVVLDAQAAI
jgi:hypothetical protein